MSFLILFVDQPSVVLSVLSVVRLRGTNTLCIGCSMFSHILRSLCRTRFAQGIPCANDFRQNIWFGVDLDDSKYINGDFFCFHVHEKSIFGSCLRFGARRRMRFDVCWGNFVKMRLSGRWQCSFRIKSCRSSRFLMIWNDIGGQIFSADCGFCIRHAQKRGKFFWNFWEKWTSLNKRRSTCLS